MNILAKEPLSIPKILDASFKLFTLSFTKIIGLSLVSGLISAGMGLFTSAMLEDLTVNRMSNLSLKIPMLVAGFIVIWFFLFIFYSAVIYRIDNVAKQQDDTFIEAISFGLRKSPSMIAAVLLYYIAIVLGMLLLIIPGLILSISLFLFGYYIVLEDKSAYQSLKSSHKVIKNNWWRTVGVFTVPGVLVIIFFFVLGLLAAFMGISETGASWLEFSINLLSGFYMPYFIALGYIQFHDLKLRKSGSDLEARMAE